MNEPTRLFGVSDFAGQLASQLECFGDCNQYRIVFVTIVCLKRNVFGVLKLRNDFYHQKPSQHHWSTFADRFSAQIG